MKFEQPEIEVKFVDGGSLQQAHPCDAGYDLVCVDKSPKMARSGRIYYQVRTGVCIELPCGIQAEIRPRSSAIQNGYHIHHGTIDPGYIGEISVLLYSDSSVPEKGERFAQIVFSPVCYPRFTLVDKLEETDRGNNGFGSSGRFA